MIHYWSLISCLIFVVSRCSRKHHCQRHMQPNHWLWSFEPTNQCVIVQSLQPANQSKDEQTQVGSYYQLLFVFRSHRSSFQLLQWLFCSCFPSQLFPVAVVVSHSSSCFSLQVLFPVAAVVSRCRCFPSQLFLVAAVVSLCSSER